MSTELEIVNRALQAAGTRTNVASLTENSNEVIQANLVRTKTRDELIRMAPWNSATIFNLATYITSAPGTPENATVGASQWARGIPAPPWAYEYQYPVDCLRPLWIVPQFSTGFAGGVPITTAVTGGAPQSWNGPPVRFKVALDLFIPVTAATVGAGGVNYAVGDLITLAPTPSGSAPIGAPVVLQVATLAGSAVATVTVVNQISGFATPQGGSYFARQTNPVAQGSTTGVGTGATFNLTFGSQAPQRVILTNQESAIFCYLKQITDPNLMDPLLEQAWVAYLAARLAFQLTGDKETANLKIGEANSFIIQARTADGNEGLTINNVTPDWIRSRGIAYGYTDWTPNNMFEWGPLLSLY